MMRRVLFGIVFLGHLVACGGGGALPAPTSLSYSSTNVFIAGIAISPLSPTVVGTVSTYAVSPSLPSGLALDSTTGAVSGTPTAAAPLGTYTVSASNSGGSIAFTVSITVMGWQKQTVSGQFSKNDLFSVAAVNSETAWAVGAAGAIVKTTDGGNSWVSQANPLGGTTTDLFSVAAVDGNTAWVVGSAGAILKTIDGGSTWTTQSSTVVGSGDLYAVAAWDADDVVAAGNLYGTGCNLESIAIFTADDGVTWEPASLCPQYPPFVGVQIKSIVATNPRVYWAVGGGGCGPGVECPGIFKSTDGGMTWSDQNPAARSTSGLVSISAINDQIAIAWANADVENPAMWETTSDGGATWSIRPAPSASNVTIYSGVAIHSILAVDDATALGVGSNGLIVKANPDGSTWVVQPSGTANDLDSIALVKGNSAIAWAVGASGTILKTTIGGG